MSRSVVSSRSPKLLMLFSKIPLPPRRQLPSFQFYFSAQLQKSLFSYTAAPRALHSRGQFGRCGELALGAGQTPMTRPPSKPSSGASHASSGVCSGQCSFSAYAAFFSCCSGTRADTKSDTVVEASRQNQQLIQPWPPPLPPRSMSWYPPRWSARLGACPTRTGTADSIQDRSRVDGAACSVCNQSSRPHTCLPSRKTMCLPVSYCCARSESAVPVVEWKDARWSVIALHHASPRRNPCACILCRCAYRDDDV